MRDEAQARSGGRCEAADFHSGNCDGSGREAHHIWPTQFGGPDELWNLMWVNPNCHARIHRQFPGEARQRGYLARDEWDHQGRFRLWETT